MSRNQEGGVPVEHPSRCETLQKKFSAYRDRLSHRSELVPGYDPQGRTLEKLKELAANMAKQHAEGGCTVLEAHEIKHTAMHQLGRDKTFTQQEIERFLQQPAINYHLRLRVATWLAIGFCATLAASLGFADKVEVNSNGTLDVDDSVSSLLRVAFFAMMAWTLSKLKWVARTAAAKSFPDLHHQLGGQDDESREPVILRVIDGSIDDNRQTIRENALKWVHLKHADLFSEQVKTAVDNRIKTMYERRADMPAYDRRRATELYFSMLFSNLLAPKISQTLVSVGFTFGVSRAVESAASQMDSVAGYRAVNFFAQDAFIFMLLLFYGQMVVQLGAGSLGMAFGSLVYSAIRCASSCGLNRVLGMSDGGASLLQSDHLGELDGSLGSAARVRPVSHQSLRGDDESMHNVPDPTAHSAARVRPVSHQSSRGDDESMHNVPDPTALKGNREGGVVILPARPGAGMFEPASPRGQYGDGSNTGDAAADELKRVDSTEFARQI